MSHESYNDDYKFVGYCEICDKTIKEDEEMYQLDDLNCCKSCYSSAIDDAEYTCEVER